jgi:hypothetical protein
VVSGCSLDETAARLHLDPASPGSWWSRVFLNYAVWESCEHFKQAFTHPEFRSHLAHYPPSTVASPHLFQKLAIPGVCVA